MSQQQLLFLGTEEDRKYLPYLKNCTGSANVAILLSPIQTVKEITFLCQKRGITGVITTNKTLLTKLLGRENERKQPSLNDYAGSMFKRDGIEFVFINPLEHFITVPYGSFVTRRFISKLASPELWVASTNFQFAILDNTNVESIFSHYQNAYAIAVDIETFKDPLSIRCIGYTAIFIDTAGEITTHSCVLPMDSMWAVAWMRKFNWELQAPKIFQNGKYDISYLSMYDAVPYAYLWDTAHLFHSWYSELPKDLAFLNAFFVREAMYWKDLAETNDLQEYYRYNALDTWTTANVWISQILQMPKWAKENYLQEFPLVFPCHLAEMTGLKRNVARMNEGRKVIKTSIESKMELLRTMTATPGINPNSPVQVLKLLKILGCDDVKTTNEKDLKKAILRHPINAKILNTILDIRGDRKLLSTYLRSDEDIEKKGDRGSKELKGRILYALNPHGTDTGRLASKEHHFWCGLQLQNIPRGEPGETSWTKYSIESDEDFLLAECDLEQAESRDTAYAAGEENLIAAVSGERDFHSVNASCFFGVPYDQIYNQELRKTIDKALRDIAKRVNHGANYLMGAAVLVDTMGEDKVYEARTKLNLPRSWSLIQIAEYLLEKFHETYPGLAGVYYPAVVAEVMTTRMLVGATGWTRYCFGNPLKNKRDKNSYVAHVSQSLNAQKLNKAYIRIFYEIAINPDYSANFKLCGQIHDSILFQFRKGHEYLCGMVKERMEIPLTIKGYDGKVRTYTVPAAVKAGKDGSGARYWSDTE